MSLGEVDMFLGMYALEPGFSSYDCPLTKFLVPGDVSISDSLDLIAVMLCKQGVEVRVEHDFSCEAVYDGEIEPDMHLLIFPPPSSLELICRSSWVSNMARIFLWYAFGNEPVKISKSVLKVWLKEGEMAFIVRSILRPGG